MRHLGPEYWNPAVQKVEKCISHYRTCSWVSHCVVEWWNPLFHFIISLAIEFQEGRIINKHCISWHNNHKQASPLMHFHSSCFKVICFHLLRWSQARSFRNRVHMQSISIEIKRKLVSSKPYLMLTLFMSSVWSDQRMGYIFFKCFDRSGIDLKILDSTLKSSRFLESQPAKILMGREWQFIPLLEMYGCM